MKKITNTFKFTTIALVVATSLAGCSQDKKNTDVVSQTKQTAAKTLTSNDAQIFLDDVAKEMVTLGVSGARAAWIYSNFITEDTASLAAEADQLSTEAGVRFAMQAATFDNVDVGGVWGHVVHACMVATCDTHKLNPRQFRESQNMHKLI